MCERERERGRERERERVCCTVPSAVHAVDVASAVVITLNCFKFFSYSFTTRHRCVRACVCFLEFSIVCTLFEFLLLPLQLQCKWHENDNCGNYNIKLGDHSAAGLLGVCATAVSVSVYIHMYNDTICI